MFKKYSDKNLNENTNLDKLRNIFKNDDKNFINKANKIQKNIINDKFISSADEKLKNFLKEITIKDEINIYKFIKIIGKDEINDIYIIDIEAPQNNNENSYNVYSLDLNDFLKYKYKDINDEESINLVNINYVNLPLFISFNDFNANNKIKYDLLLPKIINNELTIVGLNGVYTNKSILYCRNIEFIKSNVNKINNFKNIFSINNIYNLKNINPLNEIDINKYINKVKNDKPFYYFPPHYDDEDIDKYGYIYNKYFHSTKKIVSVNSSTSLIKSLPKNINDLIIVYEPPDTSEDTSLQQIKINYNDISLNEIKDTLKIVIKLPSYVDENIFNKLNENEISNINVSNEINNLVLTNLNITSFPKNLKYKNVFLKNIPLFTKYNKKFSFDNLYINCKNIYFIIDSLNYKNINKNIDNIISNDNEILDTFVNSLIKQTKIQKDILSIYFVLVNSVYSENNIKNLIEKIEEQLEIHNVDNVEIFFKNFNYLSENLKYIISNEMLT